ncbi:MAG: aspartate-semialdehyde dehydrogenase [Polyangia bacterium]
MPPATVAVVGATGAVGKTMLAVLEERDFPVRELIPLASAASAGKLVDWRGGDLSVRDLAQFDFDGVEIALFSAGGSVSREHAPRAAAAGAVVVDNTSAFRMEDDVPLVVPEINPDAARDRPRGIIANPNCSTIQMLVALAPLHRRSRIERIVVATYQAVSGAGARGAEELERSSLRALEGRDPEPGEVFSHPIGFQCLPRIGAFLDDGYTSEERKMMDETRKILADDRIGVSATCVRVPVFVGHAEAVNVQTEEPISPDEARRLIGASAGVEIADAPEADVYPLQRSIAGRDAVAVGRIRRDPSCDRALDLWIAADNLRKGAATNAVQIAELLLAGRTHK